MYFSDEAWVHLDGYINSQNYRLWCCENLHAFAKSGLHSLKIRIWCGISRRKIIGSIFFEQSINAERYQSIIHDFIANLEADERYCWLRQDGATVHMSKDTGSLLGIVGLHAVRNVTLRLFFVGLHERSHFRHESNLYWGFKSNNYNSHSVHRCAHITESFSEYDEASQSVSKCWRRSFRASFVNSYCVSSVYLVFIELNLVL